jgi:hypothetical protein
MSRDTIMAKSASGWFISLKKGLSCYMGLFGRKYITFCFYGVVLVIGLMARFLPLVLANGEKKEVSYGNFYTVS